jgi:hypothetical protein
MGRRPEFVQTVTAVMHSIDINSRDSVHSFETTNIMSYPPGENSDYQGYYYFNGAIFISSFTF